MIRLLVITCLALGSIASASSLEEAEPASSPAEEFDKAASAYESLIGENGPSASLYYNLGNARQKLGQTGRAILAYERAKLLSPRDPDLAANLALARKNAAIFETPTLNPHVLAMIRKLSRNEWSWLLVGSALFLGLLSLANGALPEKKPWIRTTTVASGSIALVLAALSATALWLRRDEGNRAVVIAKDASVLLSPFETAESIGTPKSGTIVMLGKTNGGFRFITVPGTSLAGWIVCDQVEKIEGS